MLREKGIIPKDAIIDQTQPTVQMEMTVKSFRAVEDRFVERQKIVKLKPQDFETIDDGSQVQGFVNKGDASRENS